MEESLIELEPPDFQERKSFLLAGLSESYTAQTSSAIPAQWQRFAPHIGHIPGQLGWTSYGVCYDGDGAGNMKYICAVEVTDFAELPAGLIHFRMPDQKYAVFTHTAHISRIRSTWQAIFKRWLPASGHKMAAAPEFELYDERFDPRTGNGAVEIWIPIER